MTVEEVAVEAPGGLCLRGLLYPARSTAARAPLCLCIHGLGVDANVWGFVAPEIQARGVSALCLDLSGHGLSGRTGRWQLAPRPMARDLLAACRRLGLAPDVLLAQSFGACVALELLALTSEATAPVLFAVTPVWTGTRKSFRTLPSTALAVARFLRRVGRQGGYAGGGEPARRDHTQFAGQGDHHLPRFAAEAASVSWMSYARMLIWLRLQGYLHRYDWRRLAPYPVRMVAATDEGLWNNRELEAVQRHTGWPLHWLPMQHVSLATEPQYAAPLVDLLEQDPRWPAPVGAASRSRLFPMP